MMSKTPLPSQAEVLHFLAKSLDLEASNQGLKDYLKNGDSNFRTKNKLIDELFISPLTKYMGTEVAALTKWSMEYFFDEYIKFVCTINFDTTTRDEALEILNHSYFPALCSRLLKIFNDKFQATPPDQLITDKQSCLEVTFEWLKTNHPSTLRTIQDNHQQDVGSIKAKMNKWFTGQHIPTFTDLKGMLNLANISSNDQASIACWLLISRALDWVRFKNKRLGTDFFLRLKHYVNTGEKVSTLDIHHALEKYNNKFLFLSQEDDKFRDYTHSIFHKNMPVERILTLIKNEYDKLVRLHKHHDKNGLLNYRLEQFKLFLYGQQPEIALKHIESAFKQSLYRAGEFQKILFDVAYELAKNDRVAQTRLKHQAISFGWFNAPAEHKSNSSRSEVLYEAEKVTQKKNDSKLIELAKDNDVNGVKAILENKRASVDTLSSDNQSIYLIAIEHAYDLKDDRLLKLLLENKAPKAKTLNTRDFDGNTPLIKAVLYGYDDTVEQLLIWKAEPNLQAAETARSALMLAIEQLLTLYKDGARPNWLELIKKGEPRVIENFRRHLISTGMIPSSMTTSELKKDFDNKLRDPRKQEIISRLMGHLDTKDNNDISAYKRIVSLLLKANADPNQTHDYPVPGYTPLMLAAETNDVELFKKLVFAGGEPLKTYKHPSRLDNVNCFEIAKYFNCNNIVKYLNSIKNNAQTIN